jgi:hypothetical protein
VIEACCQVECLTGMDCSPDPACEPECYMSSPKVAAIVRKELAMAIKDLMQHGLVSVRHSCTRQTALERNRFAEKTYSNVILYFGILYRLFDLKTILA